MKVLILILAGVLFSCTALLVMLAIWEAVDILLALEGRGF
jgi:hypothetical protein